MLLFDTELRPSAIHGIGVFLLEDVKEGDVIWRFDSRIDRIYSEDELEAVPPRLREFLRTYSTWHQAGGCGFCAATMVATSIIRTIRTRSPWASRSATTSPPPTFRPARN